MAYKHEILSEIDQLLGLLRPHLEYFDISDLRINRPKVCAEKGTKTYAAKILEKLDALVKDHLAELDRVRGLVSEERWKNYKLFEQEGLREQVMYKSAFRRLMRGWQFREQRKKKAKKKKSDRGSSKASRNPSQGTE